MGQVSLHLPHLLEENKGEQEEMSPSSKSLNSSHQESLQVDIMNNSKHAAFFERAIKRKEEAKKASSLKSLQN